MDEETVTVETTPEELAKLLQPEEEELTPILLLGEINDDSTTGVLSSLIVNRGIAAKSEKELELEFFINSEGGSAYEMFAIIDTMKYAQEVFPVKTVGLGKIMSAGVLLLAAGTPGRRFIGRSSRVMVHNVLSGQQGSLATLQNEFNEVKKIQEMYIEKLAEFSNLTVKQIKRILAKNQNIYISAEKAIEYGIADHIL